jgi:hypothetical protein
VGADGPTGLLGEELPLHVPEVDDRDDPGDVCCKWRFSMRTEDDPAYVPVELIKNPRGNETRRSD